jgi:hypothetical protein
LTTGVVLTLLANGVLAPSARAGCGDHLTSLRSPTGPATVNLLGPDHTRAATDRAGHPHAPCSGPQCSRAPVLPPLAPVVPPTIPAQDWACAVVPVLFAVADDFSFLLDEAVQTPDCHGTSIFHPPR